MSMKRISWQQVLLLTCALGGCSLDDRHLSSTDDEHGSLAGGGGMPPSNDDPGNSGADSGGDDAGNDSIVIPTAAGCPDLDEDRVADCAQNLLENPGFASDTSAWAEDSGAAWSWDARDALGQNNSGSGLLAAATAALDVTGSAPFSAAQCARVRGTQVVSVFANARIDRDQDDRGLATVYVSFFDSSDCSGASTIRFNTPQPLSPSPGQWFTLKAGLLTSESTKSALVQLTVDKPLAVAAFEARFDNVLLKQQPPR